MKFTTHYLHTTDKHGDCQWNASIFPTATDTLNGDMVNRKTTKKNRKYAKDVDDDGPIRSTISAYLLSNNLLLSLYVSFLFHLHSRYYSCLCLCIWVCMCCVCLMFISLHIRNEILFFCRFIVCFLFDGNPIEKSANHCNSNNIHEGTNNLHFCQIVDTLNSLNGFTFEQITSNYPTQCIVIVL